MPGYSNPPPRVHETTVHVKKKSLLDILAEVDDWYAKEISSPNPWAMPLELLNLDQKREIFRVAIYHGMEEAIFLALVTPFAYGIATGGLTPFAELGATGRLLAFLVLGWPHLLLPVLPLIFIQKIRGNITRLICRELVIARAIGLVTASWLIAMAFLYAPLLRPFIEQGLAMFPSLSASLSSSLLIIRDSYLWLALSSIFSAAIPFAAVVFVPFKAQKKWEDLQDLLNGII